MSVFSKCNGTNCPKKSQCYRFTVEALPKYQPWLVQQVSVPDPIKECRFYIDNEEKTE